MFKDMVKLWIVFLLLFVIWSCGTMSKPNDEKLSVPTKVSIEMPKALKSTKKRRRKEKSLAYSELKEDVAYLENLRIDVEVNLLFINQVIGDIEKRCKETSIKHLCTIPEYELFFTFDKNLSESYTALTNEKEIYEIGDEITYGEVSFIQYLDSAKYQYQLIIDTSFDKSEKSSQTVKWSKDERNILSSYKEETSTLKSEIKIDFSKKESGEKQMIVDDGFRDKEDNSSDSFHFEILKKSDPNQTYIVTSNSKSINRLKEINSFDSTGELSNIGGFLRFNGVFNGDKLKEYETFDGEGNLLNVRYCYEYLDCNLEDESSWIEEIN